MKRLRRTMLFIPGNSPNMVQNAGILGGDSIILDLEDAVSMKEKDSARILVRNAMKKIDFYGGEIVVRINPLTTTFGYEDIHQIGRVKPDILMIPKATEEDLNEVSEILRQIEDEEGFEREVIKLFPIIETAYAIENVYGIIKSSPRVIGALLGAEDLTADLEIRRTRLGEEIFYARSKMAAACRARGIDAIDTPFADVNDMEGLIKDTNKGRSLGMTGKAAINPRQIEIIHQILAPSEEEIRYAKRIMFAVEEAKEQQKGVFSLDGKMIDGPIIARAEGILSKASQIGRI